MFRFLSFAGLYISITVGQIVPPPYGPISHPGVPPVPIPAASAARAGAFGYNPALHHVPPRVAPFTPIPGVPVPPIPGIPPVSGVRNPYYNNNGLPAPAVPILTYSNEPAKADGTYAFSFSTADGKQAQENGFLKDAYIDNNGEPQGTQVVQGSYAYIAPDGTPIQVSYVADENGFRPSGVHIPADGNYRNYTNGGFNPAYNRYNPYNPFINPYNRVLPGAYHPTGAYNPAAYNPTAYNPYRSSWQNPGYNYNPQDISKKG